VIFESDAMGKDITTVMRDTGVRRRRLPNDGLYAEATPSDQKQQASYRRDRSEDSRAGERQRVEASRKQQDAGGEKPAGGPEQRDLTEVTNRGRNDQDRERMVHLVPHSRFKHGEHFGRKPAFQTVGAKRPKRDTEKAQQRSNQ
jgi:hypothetical protein